MSCLPPSTNQGQPCLASEVRQDQACSGGRDVVKGVKYMVTEKDLLWVVSTQCNIQLMNHRIVYLKTT